MTSEPFLAWLPAAGDGADHRTVVAAAVEVSWVTVKPASSSVLARRPRSGRPRSGTGTVVAWLPIAMLTVLAPSTLVPGSGSELITLPIWSASPSVWVWCRS